MPSRTKYSCHWLVMWLKQFFAHNFSGKHFYHTSCGVIRNWRLKILRYLKNSPNPSTKNLKKLGRAILWKRLISRMIDSSVFIIFFDQNPKESRGLLRSVSKDTPSNWRWYHYQRGRFAADSYLLILEGRGFRNCFTCYVRPYLARFWPG